MDIASATAELVLTVSGSVTAFDGFLRVYREGRDGDAPDEHAEFSRIEALASIGRLRHRAGDGSGVANFLTAAFGAARRIWGESDRAAGRADIAPSLTAIASADALGAPKLPAAPAGHGCAASTGSGLGHDNMAISARLHAASVAAIAAATSSSAAAAVFGRMSAPTARKLRPKPSSTSARPRLRANYARSGSISARIVLSRSTAPTCSVDRRISTIPRSISAIRAAAA